MIKRKERIRPKRILKFRVIFVHQKKMFAQSLKFGKANERVEISDFR